MRVWMVSPTAPTFHFRPTCRNGLFRELIELELKPEQVQWEWDALAKRWWPWILAVQVNGKVRRVGPCTMCCPVRGPYTDCMKWLAGQLGAVPPQAG